PVLASIRGFENGRVFHAGVDRVCIRKRRLQMPHALELPRMLGAVIPLVRGQRGAVRIVGKLVAVSLGHTLGSCLLPLGCPRLMPRLSPVIGALNDLSEPPASLRHKNAVGINRGSLHVINLPSRKVRTADFPFITLTVGRKYECSFARAYQDSHLAHVVLLRNQMKVL